MKKTYLLICCLLAAATISIHAQEFYFTASGGYGFHSQTIQNTNLCTGIFSGNNQGLYSEGFNTLGAFAFSNGNRNVSTTYYANGSIGSTQMVSETHPGFGGGLNFSVSAGYSVNKNIAFEINFSYLSGQTLQTNLTVLQNNYSFSDTSVYTTSINSQAELTARYRITPLVKITAPCSKISPYLKAGLLIGMGGTITVTNAFNDSYSYTSFGQTSITPDIVNASAKAYGGISFGFYGAAGAEFSLSDLFSIYCEVNKLEDKWTPTQGEVLSFTESGITNIPIVNPDFTYSNNSSSSNITPSGNKTLTVNSQYPAQTFSLGSWGFVLGIKLSLAKPKSDKAE